MQILKRGRSGNTDGSGYGGFMVGGELADQPNGARIRNDGHASWVAIQQTIPDNPQEWIIYADPLFAQVKTVPGTSRIIAVSQSQAFWHTMQGRKVSFNWQSYRCQTVIHSNEISVTNVDGSSVTFPDEMFSTFYYCETSGTGTCDVVGDLVTWKTGDPFVPFYDAQVDFELRIDGQTVQVTDMPTWPTEYRLSAAPGDVIGAVYSYRLNINDQISTFRLQGMRGANEENFTIAFMPWEVRLFTTQAGYGRHVPIRIYKGDDPVWTLSDANGRVGSVMWPRADVHLKSGQSQWGDATEPSWNVVHTYGGGGVWSIGFGNRHDAKDRFWLRNNGDLYAHGTFGQPTDSASTENVALAPDYDQKLRSLAVKLFSYTEDELTSANRVGLIANEVEAVFPELVYTDSQGKKFVQASDLIYYLLKAWQGTDAQLQSLEARVAALEG